MDYTTLSKEIGACLNPLQAYIYLGLCLHTDFKTDISNINQDTLAEFLQCDVGTVQRSLRVFQENHLLTIHQDRYGWREKNRYRLNRSNWFGVYRKILEEDIPREHIGFLLLLKSLCYSHCNYTDYYGRDLQEMMVLKRSMIDNYLRILEAKQYIKRDKKKKRITILQDDLFLKTEESEKEKIMKICPETMGDDDYIDEHGRYHFVD